MGHNGEAAPRVCVPASDFIELLGAFINIRAMPDFYHLYYKLVFSDLINDSIKALPDTI